MPPPLLVTIKDFSVAELSSASHDGDLVPFHGSWAASDEPDHPGLRALTFAAQNPRNLIVCGLSAAWIHGSLNERPEVLHLCVPRDSRVSSNHLAKVHISEVSIEGREIIEISGVPCTSIVRTALDILRSRDITEEIALSIVRDLCTQLPDSSLREIQLHLSSRSRAPHKRYAQRLWERVNATSYLPGTT